MTIIRVSGSTVEVARATNILECTDTLSAYLSSILEGPILLDVISRLIICNLVVEINGVTYEKGRAPYCVTRDASETISYNDLESPTKLNADQLVANLLCDTVDPDSFGALQLAWNELPDTVRHRLVAQLDEDIDLHNRTIVGEFLMLIERNKHEYNAGLASYIDLEEDVKQYFDIGVSKPESIEDEEDDFDSQRLGKQT